MSNISSRDAQSLLKQAATAIRTLKGERDDLRTKVAHHEREDRVVKIAREMEDKDLNADMTFEEKVASVRKAKSLDATEEAIKMAAPQGNLLADVGDDEAAGGGTDAFTHFIMTGEDPTE
jgi:hypothetical protein